MGRDLLESPYGRFFHLPRLLAARGFEVGVLLMSYRNEPETVVRRDGVEWRSVGLTSYVGRAIAFARRSRPDWIVGFSDTYFGILAQTLARRLHARSLIDAYDNYEGYIPWAWPLHWLWRRALAGATLVSAAGPGLAELMAARRPGKPTIVVPMAVDPAGFRRLDRAECRRRLALPEDAPLVGYCGALHRNRGVELLFEAFEAARARVPDLRLVLSGRLYRGVRLPDNARWLGYVPDALVPALINSLDVMTVINRPTAFGHHSYPIKLYEAMKCGVPVAVTATPATCWILRDHPELLVPPEDPAALASGIIAAIGRCRVDYGPQGEWEDACTSLQEALCDCT
jgi:glycosyltransferase involved in cell wall biosynthesis